MSKSHSSISFARLFCIAVVLFGMYGTLIANLYNLQIAKEQYYAARAESQHRLAGYLTPSRGNIYITDKYANSIPAAINKSYPTIFAVPKEVEDVEEASALLGNALGMDVGALKITLGKPNDLYELLVKRATPDEVRRVRDANVKGVYVDSADYRYYPFGNLAAQVLGYVGPGSDNKEIGRYGIEAQYNDSLQGTDGLALGDTIQEPTPGNDIHLTIDRNIEARGEEILQHLVETTHATGGSVIVEDPKTGKILALGNDPTFDPNAYASYPVGSFLNPSAQLIYEPGSVVKLITMAGALDAGKVTPDTAFYDVGFLTLDGKTVRNWDLKAHGKVTMTDVIAQSINTGAAFAERKLGDDAFYQTLVNFGFSDATGVGLPGELSGNLRNLKRNVRAINFATASFGQGISVTPLELLSAIGAIANDGMLMRPSIIAEERPQMVRRVIAPAAAEEVTRMMVTAVKGAKVADIPGYDVAGKTGTAQVADLTHGGYAGDVIDSYVGYAPAFDPRFLILIKLDKPKDAPLAGTTVVPAFRELAEFLLQYYDVPPTRAVNND